MKYILILCVLLSGCARNTCQIAIDNLQPLPKIPKDINIQLEEGSFKADNGGVALLQNYAKTSRAVTALKESCSD